MEINKFKEFQIYFDRDCVYSAFCASFLFSVSFFPYHHHVFFLFCASFHEYRPAVHSSINLELHYCHIYAFYLFSCASVSVFCLICGTFQVTVKMQKKIIDITNVRYIENIITYWNIRMKTKTC